MMQIMPNGLVTAGDAQVINVLDDQEYTAFLRKTLREEASCNLGARAQEDACRSAKRAKGEEIQGRRGRGLFQETSLGTRSRLSSSEDQELGRQARHLQLLQHHLGTQC